MVDNLHDLIAARLRIQKHEDTLTAGFWVVESLDVLRAQTALRALCHAPGLCRDDADLAQLLAAKLGQTLTWGHYIFHRDQWQEGRGA